MSDVLGAIDSSKLPSDDDLKVERLGEAKIPSPLAHREPEFANEGNRILVASQTKQLEALLPLGGTSLPSFESAGPREKLFFDPEKVSCGIVTCGGLCPGLNDVIRSVVMTLWHRYGVRRILGFRFGYAGISSNSLSPPMFLEPSTVENIHEQGGTILGSSRGPQDLGDMADTLVKWGVDILFAVGGDGTLKGASALHSELSARNLNISVIGIPKTIDNDLAWIERSFGFATAVESAGEAIAAAHTEAESAWNGIGLVKLMGRHSGFIAATGTLTNGDVDFCLVPEVPFGLEGKTGFLETLAERIRKQQHAVVVVAEGAGQELFEEAGSSERDASGNIKLSDIGLFLKGRIHSFFKGQGLEFTIKYIDPSYIIRSLRANAMDSGFCLILGQHAVHAGMAGRTNMMVGFWNHNFTHIPLPLAVGRRKQLDPTGKVWERVLGATLQPRRMNGEAE